MIAACRGDGAFPTRFIPWRPLGPTAFPVRGSSHSQALGAMPTALRKAVGMAPEYVQPSLFGHLCKMLVAVGLTLLHGLETGGARKAVIRSSTASHCRCL